MGQWWDEFLGNPPAARVEKDPISEFGRELSMMYLTCFVYYLIGNAESQLHCSYKGCYQSRLYKCMADLHCFCM